MLPHIKIFPLKTKTVPPYTTTNVIVYGNEAFLVIDPGSKDKNERAILDDHINYRINLGHKFEMICLTHFHGDHVGGAFHLAQTFKVPILAQRHTASQVKFKIDTIIDDDAFEITLSKNISVRAIHTPGHAEGHLVFYDEGHGILMTGDMVTDRGTTLVPPFNGSLKKYLDSMELLTTLKLQVLIPAHGLPIDEKPHAFLLKVIKHRYERILSILNAIQKKNELLDATDITRLVYRDSISEDLVPFAQMSVESSLFWLLEGGMIENVNHRWRAKSNAESIKATLILRPLEEINERLRNA